MACGGEDYVYEYEYVCYCSFLYCLIHSTQNNDCNHKLWILILIFYSKLYTYPINDVRLVYYKLFVFLLATACYYKH
jgi:hypothetical protein